MENRLVVIVSKNLADRFWPGEDPIGKRLKWGLADVAGAVADRRRRGRRCRGRAARQRAGDSCLRRRIPRRRSADWRARCGGLCGNMKVAVNGEVDAASLTTSVRAAIAAVDPALAITKVTTMTEVVRELSAPQRFSATVLTAFAAGALLLAGIGLYGVLAFGVAQRTREIGVRWRSARPRRSAGARWCEQGMLLVAGASSSAWPARLPPPGVLRSLLFETPIYDPLTFPIVPVLLALVSLAACYVPARRAAVVDPKVTLRTE